MEDCGKMPGQYKCIDCSLFQDTCDGRDFDWEIEDPYYVCSIFGDQLQGVFNLNGEEASDPNAFEIAKQILQDLEVIV